MSTGARERKDIYHQIKSLQTTHSNSNKDTQSLSTLSVVHRQAALTLPRRILEMLLALGPSYWLSIHFNKIPRNFVFPVLLRSTPLKQGSSNCSMLQNHLQGLLKQTALCQPLTYFWFSKSGYNSRICMPKFLGDADSACLGTTWRITDEDHTQEPESRESK